jgi:uncharacterized membrane protein
MVKPSITGNFKIAVRYQAPTSVKKAVMALFFGAES